MSVSGILGWLNIRGLNVRLDIPDEIYCEVDTLITVRLQNSKRRFPAFLMKVAMLGKTVGYDLLAGAEEGKNSFLIRFPERGNFRIAAAELSSPFPINFFVRSRWVAVDRQVMVFPAPAPCDMPAGCCRTDRNGAMILAAKGLEGDVTKISEYTGSEPLKLIHWRLSAKHGDLKVKELGSLSHEPVLLDLDSLPGRDREGMISCAAFLVNRLVRNNRKVGLKLGERFLPPGDTRNHRLNLLSELAMYDKN